MDSFLSISGFALSFIGVLISVWFASSAKKDAEKAQNTLDNVNKAIDGWQDKIMSSTASILDSQPQIIQAKVTLAKIETAQLLVDGIKVTINEIANNPQPGASGHTQQEILKTLSLQLNDLLASTYYEEKNNSK